jgi:hypothetical protein
LGAGRRDLLLAAAVGIFQRGGAVTINVRLQGGREGVHDVSILAHDTLPDVIIDAPGEFFVLHRNDPGSLPLYRLAITTYCYEPDALQVLPEAPE